MASVQVSDMESGEGMDRATLSLTGAQEALLRAVAATDTPLITVFIQGRPLDMTLASELSDALLTAWYPGERGGAALASVLLGDANPSGRLPLSVPRDAGQLPVYYQQGRVNDYADMPGSPLYPFGYGLGYTTFSYDSIAVSARVCDKRLVGFQKLNLAPGETAVAVFDLDIEPGTFTIMAGPSSADLPLVKTVRYPEFIKF